jgi:hypothetical protein
MRSLTQFDVLVISLIADYGADIVVSVAMLWGVGMLAIGYTAARLWASADGASREWLPLCSSPPRLQANREGRSTHLLTAILCCSGLPMNSRRDTASATIFGGTGHASTAMARLAGFRMLSGATGENESMSRLQKLRDMNPQEVERAHRIFSQFGGDTEKVIEAITDLRAYCGRAWPKMLEEALKRYNRDRRGDK